MEQKDRLWVRWFMHIKLIRVDPITPYHFHLDVPWMLRKTMEWGQWLHNGMIGQIFSRMILSIFRQLVEEYSLTRNVGGS